MTVAISPHARAQLTGAGIIDDSGLLRPDWEKSFIEASRTLDLESIRAFTLISFGDDRLVRDLVHRDRAIAALPAAAQLKSFGQCASQAKGNLKVQLDQRFRKQVVEGAERVLSELSSSIAPIDFRIAPDLSPDMIRVLEKGVSDLQGALDVVRSKLSFTWAPEETVRDGINESMARLHFTFGSLCTKISELHAALAEAGANNPALAELADSARILTNGLRELAERSGSKVVWPALHKATLRGVGLEGAVWSERWPELVQAGAAPSFDVLQNVDGRAVSLGSEEHVARVLSARDPDALARREPFDPRSPAVLEHMRGVTDAQISGAEKAGTEVLDRPLHKLAAYAGLGVAHVNPAWSKQYRIPSGPIPAEVRISPGGSGGKDLWGMVMKLAVGPDRQINVHTTGGREAAEDSQVRSVDEQMALMKLANSEGFDRFIDMAKEDPSAYLAIVRFLKMRTSLESVAQVQAWTRGQVYALEDHDGKVHLFHGRFRPLSAPPVKEGIGAAVDRLLDGKDDKTVEQLRGEALRGLSEHPIRWAFELTPVRKNHAVDGFVIPDDIPKDVPESGWAAFMVLELQPGDFATLTRNFHFADRDVYSPHDGHAPTDMLRLESLPDDVRTKIAPRMDEDAPAFLSPLYSALGAERALAYGVAGSNRGCPLGAAKKNFGQGATFV